MGISADIPAPRTVDGRASQQNRRIPQPLTPLHFPAQAYSQDAANHQAELFYLQKQIHSQTQMVFILEDGERIDGHIEWYDRYSIKVRGRSKTLIYKSAIKYMYKLGDNG